MERGNLYTKRNKTLRDKFGEISTEYEEYRLDYPIDLFNDIFKFSDSGKKALEIGIGTGKATPAFLNVGYKVCAIEPVKNMLDIAKKKFADKSISFINSTFEDLRTVEKFDLIYAASSFQWINGCDRLSKVYELLKDGGSFARFKTINIIDDCKQVNNKLLTLAYKQYLPDYLPTDSHKKISNEEYEVVGFTGIIRKEYFRDYVFDVEMYLNLINTYTEYLILDSGLRRKFESYIRELLAGKDVVITQKCTLSLARK